MGNTDKGRSGAVRAASGDAANLILKGTHLDGKLNFAAQTVVSGRISGEITCQNTLFIELGGRVEGRVQAPTIVVYGELDGTILATEFLEICTGAVVAGAVKARSVRVDQGAKLTADLSISADLPASLDPAQAAPAPAQPAPVAG
ncbi:MAG: polymer-forming cytoskeletal protein [Hyphomonas sp.]|uniref:bactofilin family protein n=1 Tax=Hyphomonas sp. TaxID=87 RepID=UPI00352873BB